MHVQLTMISTAIALSGIAIAADPQVLFYSDKTIATLQAPDAVSFELGYTSLTI